MAATIPARARMSAIDSSRHCTEVRTRTISSRDKRGFDHRDRGNMGSLLLRRKSCCHDPSAGEASMGMKLSARGVSETLDPVVVVGSATAERLSGHRSTSWTLVEGAGQTSLVCASA